MTPPGRLEYVVELISPALCPSYVPPHRSVFSKGHLQHFVRFNIFGEAVKFHDYVDGESSNLKDINNLFKFRNFIISNSTFSLIPAIVNSTYNGYVVYPKNWKDDDIGKINNDNWIGF